MTGPEREDFRELRNEMREGFRDVKAAVEGLTDRVSSLEITRAADMAVREDRRTAHARIDAERRWRIGLTLGVLSSVGVGVVNFFLNVG